MDERIFIIQKAFDNLAGSLNGLLVNIMSGEEEGIVMSIANLVNMAVNLIKEETVWIREQRKKEAMDKKLLQLSFLLKDPIKNKEDLAKFRDSLTKLKREFLKSI